jgi:short-subunit dehydrogenase
MRKVLIVGAASAIAEAVARLFAADHDALCLAGRNAARLDAIAADLRVRGAAQVETLELDANDYARHEAVLARAAESMGGLDTVLVAHGTLPDQKACERSVDATLAALTTNALSVIALLTLVANRFEAQRAGTIALLSSVAGDRGRQSNYVYGTAKAAVSTFAQGLRGRLARSGVRVITIKPGFVDTPMTAAFKKGALWASPAAVATRIHRAIATGEEVVYVPWFWRWIMLVIKAVPEPMFKKVRL